MLMSSTPVIISLCISNIRHLKQIQLSFKIVIDLKKERKSERAALKEAAKCQGAAKGERTPSGPVSVGIPTCPFPGLRPQVGPLTCPCFRQGHSFTSALQL